MSVTDSWTRFPIFAHCIMGVSWVELNASEKWDKSTVIKEPGVQ